MQNSFKVYSDPGHAWCKVSLYTLVDLGIHEKITPFSYVRGFDAYLEEDCDIAKFVDAYREETGVSPHLAEQPSADQQSRIRSYRAYSTEYCEITLLVRALQLQDKGQLKGKDERMYQMLRHKLPQYKILEALYQNVAS